MLKGLLTLTAALAFTAPAFAEEATRSPGTGIVFVDEATHNPLQLDYELPYTEDSCWSQERAPLHVSVRVSERQGSCISISRRVTFSVVREENRYPALEWAESFYEANLVWRPGGRWSFEPYIQETENDLRDRFPGLNREIDETVQVIGGRVTLTW